MENLSERNNSSLPKWPTLLAIFLLAAGGLLGVLVLLNNVGAAELDSGMLMNAARWLSIVCGLAAAVIYVLLRKQHRARAALLGNLILVAGLVALGAWQFLEKESGAETPAGEALTQQRGVDL